MTIFPSASLVDDTWKMLVVSIPSDTMQIYRYVKNFLGDYVVGAIFLENQGSL